MSEPGAQQPADDEQPHTGLTSDASRGGGGAPRGTRTWTTTSAAEIRPVSARELVVRGTPSQAPTRDRNHNGCLVR